MTIKLYDGEGKERLVMEVTKTELTHNVGVRFSNSDSVDLTFCDNWAEILRITVSGEFLWHPDADRLIAELTSEQQSTMKHILIALRERERFQQFASDAFKSAADAQSDAARYRHIEKQFSPFSVNVEGNHAWQWRGSPDRLRGPNLSAAIDRAMKGLK